jgi:hypothetical protein
MKPDPRSVRTEALRRAEAALIAAAVWAYFALVLNEKQ